MSQPIAITGANGNLGVRMIKTIGEIGVRALVRDRIALNKVYSKTIQTWMSGLSTTRIPAAFEARAKAAKLWFTQVGILKENAQSNYLDAHENSCTALVSSLPDSVQRIVYLSIVGSRADHSNTCLASKGKAEDILLASDVDVLVFQVPMVLGRVIMPLQRCVETLRRVKLPYSAVPV